jgi:Transposase
MSVTDTAALARGNSAGVDWAKDDYAVCVVDGDGKPVERVTLRYTKTGLRRLVELLDRHRVDAVGIERPDGPIIDALLGAGGTVYVIPPSQVKALRRRYGSAGNKDDRFDAYVLADTVRTDRRRLTPLVLDSQATTALRKLCRARKDLVAHRIAVANQLRAHLQTALPAAVDLFNEIDSPISLRFLARFTTQDAVDWLSPKRLTAWLKSVSYCGRTDPAVLHARITAAPRGGSGEFGQALAGITHAYLATLQAIPHPDRGTDPTDHRSTPDPPRQTDLHIAAASRDRARCPTAGRNRRRPRPLPHRRLPGLPRRCRPLHPPVRQGQSRHLPLVGRQATARYGLRLRRRQPTRQRLGG